MRRRRPIKIKPANQRESAGQRKREACVIIRRDRGRPVCGSEDSW